MGVDDGPELRRAPRGREADPEPLQGGTAITTRVVVGERPRPGLEIETDGARPVEPDSAQAFAEADRCAPRREKGHRRIDEGRRKPLARDQRAARASACREGLAQQRRGESGRAFRRVGVQAGKQHRAPQPFIERAGAGHRLRDRRRSPARISMAERREIFADRRSRRAPSPIEQPPGHAPFVGPQPPALAAPHVGEIEDGGSQGRPDSSTRADPTEIVERRVVAGQQQMIAVVDDEAEGLVEVGSAAPAGGARRLVHDRREGRPRRGARRRSSRRRRPRRRGRSGRS